MEPKFEQRCCRRTGLGSIIPCGDFTKDVKSINTGLFLYDYFLHAKKSTGQNVNILQNRNGATLSSWNTQRSFGNCIETCPRCINIYKRGKRLLKNISTLGTRNTLGVCSNCDKIQTDTSHCECNFIFKKFLDSSAKDLDIDEHKTCLSKSDRLTTGFFENEAANNRLKLQKHSYSDSNLTWASKKYWGQKNSQNPTDGREIKIRPLFQSEIDLSKLYITRTCHSFIQEQKANSPGQQASPTPGFRKTRLRIRKQPHDQNFQFHFIFPSEKKVLDSRPQVSSSLLLYDIQANSKRKLPEKIFYTAKTNKQTSPWQRDFSISSLQEKSIEFLNDIHAKYWEMILLENKISEERYHRDLEKKNVGAKTNKQTLPWQNDFSQLSLEGKALDLLNDIRANYMETKILEDKILDLEKKNLTAKSDIRILPWERDFSVLGLEGNSLELLQFREKYRKIKILKNKILSERRGSDLEMKNLGLKTNNQTLPWQNDLSHLGLEGNSLELLHDIQEKYRKTKILDNKILSKRRSSDLTMKNLGAKTNKQILPWQRDSPLVGVEGNSLELLHDIQEKYRKTKILDNKILAKRRSSDLKMKNLGAKTNKQILPWQRDSSLVGLKGNSLEPLHDIQEKYRKTKILENKILSKRRSSDLTMKNLGAKTNKQILPWQRDSPLVGVEGNSLELLHDIQDKYRKTKILENKILAKRRSSDLKMKNLGAKTNKQILPWQKDSSLVGLKGNSLEPLHDIQEKYRKTKILENKILAKRRSSDLKMKNLGAKTNKQILPWQRDSSPVGLKGNSLEPLHDIQEKYRKTKILENKILAKRRSSDITMKNLGAKKKKQILPLQTDSSLLSLKENSLELLYNIQAKYENKKRQLEVVRDFVTKINKHRFAWQKDYSLLSVDAKYEEKKRQLEKQRSRNLAKKIPGAKTKKHELPRQNNYSLLKLEAKHEEKQKHSEEQRNNDIETKVPGVETKKHELPLQKDYSLLNLEIKNEEKQKHLEKRHSKDLETKKHGAKTKDNGLPLQRDSSLLYMEAKYEKKEKHLEKQHSKDLEKNKLGAKTKKHGLPSQKNSSHLSIAEKYEKNKRHLENQHSKDLEKKKLGAKTKDEGLPWQKDSSLLYMEAKYDKKERHLEKQHSKDLEKKKLGAKTKKHGLPWQKDSSHSSIEEKYEKKKRRLEDQLSRDLGRTESKNLGATISKYKLPWQKKDSAHLNLEEKTATITRANVITDELSKRYPNKIHGLNAKEDGINILNDMMNDSSETNLRLLGRTPKEIEEKRKKKQAILEMLTRLHKKKTSEITVTQQNFFHSKMSGLATEREVRKMNIYGMVLSQPEFDWFAKNKDKGQMFYDSGEILAEFSEAGRCRWFYRDGKLALDYYDTEKTPPGRRYVVYSNGKSHRKGRARRRTVLASFDHSGNAVVFDHAGNIRLKYDQHEGRILDPSIGPESHWKWHSFSDEMSKEDELGKKYEPTNKQRVHKFESKKLVPVKSKKITQSYKPFEIKMKALKINENFSLKILDQAKVYLIYNDDTTHIKINIGMKMNRMEIVYIETCYVDDVYNPLEKFPADTQSVERLQAMVTRARRAERARVRRLHRLMHPPHLLVKLSRNY